MYRCHRYHTHFTCSFFCAMSGLSGMFQTATSCTLFCSTLTNIGITIAGDEASAHRKSVKVKPGSPVRGNCWIVIAPACAVRAWILHARKRSPRSNSAMFCVM
mmetsp:Transcript_7963/g.21530  ORF Transcript_7963/g.21530 Transcript_7963/m.21530 type:complete len:103 (-) Transcript_7963:1225-1533(-)